MLESKGTVFMVAGLGFFFLAFTVSGVAPIWLYKDVRERERSVEQLVARASNPVPDTVVPGWRILEQFKELQRRYPEPMEQYYGLTKESSDKDFQDQCVAALKLGRRTYIAEGCWHCHSQFVRPVANESLRWGPVADHKEYQNELQRPVMFGTRRVGPDLSREGGRRSSDWHAAHFFDPRITSPDSNMPKFTWFFDGTPGKPNQRGLALIAYMQWLGSETPGFPYYEKKEEGE